jgi:xanthine dehydrogenase YagR molybdenum-binding subunit
MNRAAPDPQANMGRPEPRIDGRLKVTGEARYGSDFPVNNPAFAFLVTSAIAKGSIRSMDLSEAKAVPNVLDIFTHENTGELKPVKFGGGGGGASSSIQDFGPKIMHDGAYKVHVSYNAETPGATFGSPGGK